MDSIILFMLPQEVEKQKETGRINILIMHIYKNVAEENGQKWKNVMKIFFLCKKLCGMLRGKFWVPTDGVLDKPHIV